MTAGAVTIRREGPNIVIIDEMAKHVIGPMNWSHALAIAQAIKTKALEAQEEYRALQVAADSALLLHGGAPFTLTNHPKINREACKQAADMPGGIASQAKVGLPTVIAHPRSAGNEE